MRSIEEYIGIESLEKPKEQPFTGMELLDEGQK